MTASKPPIFVTGGWGSGTTLLRSMLNDHPDIYMPYETFYIRELWEKRAELGIESLHSDDASKRLVDLFFETPHAKLVIGDAPASLFYEAALAVPVRERTHARMLSVLSEVPMRLHGKTRWGAKNPNFVNNLDTIYDLYPDAYVIHIIRDGRAVTASREGKKIKVAQQKGLEPPVYPTFQTPSGEAVSIQLLNYAADWDLYIRIARRQTARRRGARYFEVQYERLLAEPRPVLALICGFIDASFEESMLKYYERVDEHLPDRYFRDQHANIAKPPDPSIAQRWRTRLSPVVIYALQRVIGAALRREGYDLVDAALPTADRRAVDRAVAQWWRERQWRALRRRISEADWARPLRRIYRAVRP